MQWWESKQKKNPSPTNPSDVFSTLLSLLALRKYQLWPCYLERVGHPQERVKAIMASEGEMRNVPEGGGENFGQDPELGTGSVAWEGDTTKSDYLNFDPGGMSTIKWRKSGGQVSKYTIFLRSNPISDNIKKPTVSSDITITKKSFKRLTRTPRLGYYKPTRLPKRLTQPYSSAVIDTNPHL